MKSNLVVNDQMLHNILKSLECLVLPKVDEASGENYYEILFDDGRFDYDDKIDVGVLYNSCDEIVNEEMTINEFIEKRLVETIEY